VDVVWRVSGADLAAETFAARHRLGPIVVHASGFNVLVAEDVDNTMLDGVVNEFLASYRTPLKELISIAATSELSLASFIEVGEEFASGVGLSPATLVLLGV
jgi:hypothetical protein